MGLNYVGLVPLTIIKQKHRRHPLTHPLIDPEMIQAIEDTGNTSRELPDRNLIFEQNKLPVDRPAENIVVTGCQIPGAFPHVLAALSRILDRGGISHTFLSREYCCGNNLYRPAIKAKDQEALEECRALSKKFVGRNIETMEKLGAKRLIIFCSPCYPIYKNSYPETDIVFYPQAIHEAMGRLSLKGTVDYYAGCYRLHKKFSPVPMDLASTNRVFESIDGLTVNRISAPVCCYKPEGVAHMMDNATTDLMVHVCTGCYIQALLNLPKDKNIRPLMLPELVDMAMADQA
jgi:hypothetical protein